MMNTSVIAFIFYAFSHMKATFSAFFSEPCSENNCMCTKGVGRKRKAELRFVLLWVVEKPAFLLRAGRGGACVRRDLDKGGINTPTQERGKKENCKASLLFIYLFLFSWVIWRSGGRGQLRWEMFSQGMWLTYAGHGARTPAC